MNNLKLEKQEAIRLYPEVPEWFKKTLEQSFGKECFSKEITDRVKTFEDACIIAGVKHSEVFSSNDTPDEVAYKKLKLIAKVLNEGWQPDWTNSDEYKYYPYFKLSSGFGFNRSDYYYANSHSDFGSRLCFKSSELAIYAGQQFIEIYKEFLTLNN